MSERITVPVDVLNSALRRHQTLSLRAEKHRAFGVLFVDAHDLELLDAADWQVVWGRRGTGKTALLGALHDRLSKSMEHGRVLPVLVSLEDVIVSPPLGTEADPAQRAAAYFQTFVERLADELASFGEQLETRPRRFLGLVGPSSARKDEIEALLRDLVAAVQTGRPVAAYSEVAYRKEAKEVSEKGRAAKGALELGISETGPRARAGVSASAGGERVVTETETQVQSGLSLPRYAGVKDAIERLVDLLEIERVDLLLDEWPVLDPTALTPIQPTFAELLRRAFGGTDKISVKLAANRYNTRLRGGDRRGLELGADIFEAINLDRMMLTDDQLVAFFAELLFKRLLLKESRLNVFVGKDGTLALHDFVLALFDELDAFEELVRGSEGVPRDFLVVFNKVVQTARWSVEPRLSIEDVRRALREQTLTGAGGMTFDSVASQLLVGKIKPFVIETGARTFFVRRGVQSQYTEPLEQLLELRLLHELPEAALPGDVRDEYVGFRVAYGLWLDWERARRIGNGGAGVEVDPRVQALEDVEPYLLDC